VVGERAMGKGVWYVCVGGGGAWDCAGWLLTGVVGERAMGKGGGGGCCGALQGGCSLGNQLHDR
jgi:hypothetical protein